MKNVGYRYDMAYVDYPRCGTVKKAKDWLTKKDCLPDLSYS